jgi:very-short-patch-repair endonuclease
MKDSPAHYEFYRRLCPGRRGEWHATWNEIFRRCESVIERLMADALRTVATDFKYDLCPAYSDAPRTVLAGAVESRMFWIMGQRRIATYRADFVIVGRDRSGELDALVVECDGKKWHSSSEQVEHDIRRNAEMRAMGLRVKRFTGPQIFYEGELCAWAVFAHFVPQMSCDDYGEMIDDMADA